MFPGEIVGGESWIPFVQDWSTQVDGSENLHDIDVDAFTRDPGNLVAFFKSDMKLKATGESYRNEYVGHFRVRDGKVTQFYEYLDSIPLLLAAGGSIVAPPSA
jgi:ketosteroid isomerase-like protein